MSNNSINTLSEEKEQKGEENNQNVINLNEPEKKLEENNEDNEDVFPKREKINKEYYNDIICPKCKTSAIIDNNDNDLNLKILNCGNFHCLNDIKYNSFDDYIFDLDDESEKNLEKISSNREFLVCNLCNTYKKDLTPPYDYFYICSCGANVCPECDKTHDEINHHKVKLDDKDYYCLIHGKEFNSYCIDCNANLCEKCEIIHKNKIHDVELFSNIKPKRLYVRKLADEADKQKEILTDFVKNIRNSFNDIIKTIESYLNSYILIEKTLIRRFKMGLINYQLLRNLKNKKLFENNIFKTLNNLNQENDLNTKFATLFNKIYRTITITKAEKKNKIPIINIGENMMKMHYEIGDKKMDRRVKLFDPVFVENNKNKLSLFINNRQQKELSVYYFNKTDEPKLDVIIKEMRGKYNQEDMYVTDMSYMFNNCKYLRFVDFKNWKTDNITSMEAMFQLCDIDLKGILNISKLNIPNLENMRAMFCKCSKLEGLPEINKWFSFKESNITNMSMLFNGCKNIKDIIITKEWSLFTAKLEDMSYMFNRCRNIRQIQKLNKLPTKSVRTMCGMFNNCKNLESITLSFDCTNLKDMSIMFQGCIKLTNIDIKLNNTKNLNDISGMFSGCRKLNNIKNLYLSNTESIINMVGLFKNCESLNNLPDLSKWRLINVENAKGLFYECKNLVNIPKWLFLWKFRKEMKFEEILKRTYFDQNAKNALIKSWEANKIN